MNNSAIEISRAFVEHNHVLVSVDSSDNVTVFASPEAKLSAVAEIARIYAKKPQLKFLSKSEFDVEKANQYHEQGESTLTKGIEVEVDLNDVASAFGEREEISYSEENSEIIDFVNAVFSQAVKKEANDIAVESTPTELIIRFVIDGMYSEVTRVPKGAAAAIIARIKIMAKLDTFIKKLPQDGAVTLSFLGKPIDTRISTIPAIHGERISIRLLPTYDKQLGIDDLGMSESELKKFNYLISRPKGVVLVVGPIGSGKTTSLYAAVKKLNTPNKSIVTIENPVECRMQRAGITQSQISPETGYTFAAALRSVVRQYPNVILVGEIRDKETADIAMQSSSTGHLTLASMHANSSVGSINRLKKMDVESHYISSSLQGVISQRLVRVLCPCCKQAHTVTAKQEANYNGMLKAGTTHYTPKGCSECEFKGFKGRVAIYELLVVNDRIKTLIDNKVSEVEIEQEAFKKGETLIEKGFLKVSQGVTSIEEMLLVVDAEEEMVIDYD